MLGLTAATLPAGDFRGWQSIRVIEQDGNPAIARAGDLDGDGRDELIVVNTRHSRLDVYRWLGPQQRKPAEPANPGEPNELPLAPEFEHEQVPLERLPLDVIVDDVDADGRRDLVVLLTSPNEVVSFARNDEGKWDEQRGIELLPGAVDTGHRVILLRQVGDGGRQLLISMADGIQVIEFDGDGRAGWLEPREHRPRADWWLCDIDGDGDLDLLERSVEANETLRWFSCNADGQLMPAAVLHDRPVRGATVLSGVDAAAQVLLLDGVKDGLLRRMALQKAPAEPLGNRCVMALGESDKPVWCGVMLDEQPGAVVIDADRPQMQTYTLTEDGWRAHGTYPSISDVRAIAAPQAAPGTLLLWAQDAGDLQQSRWENGRLTYPQPMPQSADAEDRMILALSSAGAVTWWIQRVEGDLDLYIWRPGDEKPQQTRFAKAGKFGKGKKQVDKALWIGDNRLIVKRQFERELNLVTLAGDEAVISEPAHLKKAELDGFRLLPRGEALKAARVTDGVLQWLDDKLHAVDQVMLPDGQKLAGYVSIGVSGAWVLEEGGGHVHRLEQDETGLPHVIETVKLDGAVAIVDDPVVGLMLQGHRKVTHVSEGQPWELKQVDGVDQRIGRTGAGRDAAIHRLTTTDVDGDGREEVLLFDDRDHQLTVLGGDEKLEPMISWPVFEDKRYPYGGDQARISPEPRVVLALDVDGDQRQDLAMLCHDRLIIYLAAAGQDE